MTTRTNPARSFGDLAAPGLVVGGLGPILVAALLVPFRDAMNHANVALVMVLVVVLAAVAGGRIAAVVGAFVATLSFDFFFTQPYLTLRISSSDDVETALLLLVIGLVVGQVVVWARRTRADVAIARSELDRFRHVASVVAERRPRDEVVAAVTDEIAGLLDLRSCVFEPDGTPTERDDLAVMQRTGSVVSSVHTFAGGEFALPRAGVELPVVADGRRLGRLVLDPEPDAGVSIEERATAVALADLLASALLHTNGSNA